MKLRKQHNMLNHHKLMNHFFAADIQSFARMAMKPWTSPVFSVIITQARMSNSPTTKVLLEEESLVLENFELLFCSIPCHFTGFMVQLCY